MSFDDDGFSVGQYTGTNDGGQYYAAWCWKGGGPTVQTLLVISLLKFL